MKSSQKSGWGSPSDWGTAIGILIAAIGLLSLISSVWTPDAAQSAATGFFGANSVMPSVVILVVGLVIAGVSRFLLKPKM
jgi:uncharacterized membrane protein YidH (DUF202 family)